MKATVVRYRGPDGACLHGVLFEGRTRLHLIASQPDVRIVSVDKREARFVTELAEPNLRRAVRDLAGAAKRCGITKSAKALLSRATA